MIDLTSKFLSAFDLAKEGFSQEKWQFAIEQIVKKNDVTYLWNDEEDNWITFGQKNKLLVMASRSFPLMFFRQNRDLAVFSEIYSKSFVSIPFVNPNEELYSINVDKIKIFSEWNSTITPDHFSLQDLFYATH